MGRELRQDVVSLFPYMVIPPLEFHSNDEWTHPAYTQPDNISPGALACHEWKYPSGCVVYRIIFRTIFFTWAPDCIKKIAYLLCGSVLAWKLTTQGPSDYLELGIRGTDGRNQCVRGVQCDTRLFLIVFLIFERRVKALSTKMIFYYVSTRIEVLCENVQFIVWWPNRWFDSCARIIGEKGYVC